MHSLDTIKKLNGEFPPEGDQVVDDPAQPIVGLLDVDETVEAIDRALAAPYDVAGAIIRYETEAVDDVFVIDLFQHLVDTGLAWTLQGSYGRTAMQMIEAGLVTQGRVPFHPSRHAVTRREREFNEARVEPLRKGLCAPSGGAK